MKLNDILQHLPKLQSQVRTTDPRPALSLRTGVRAGDGGGDSANGNRIFDSQNQHYLSADTSLDV